MKLDQPSAEVQDNLGRKVRAKILVDAAGRHVRDPMTNMPLIVDEDFDINHAIAFGRTLAPLMDPSSDPSATAAALAAMYFAFRPSGPMTCNAATMEWWAAAKMNLSSDSGRQRRTF